MWGLVDCDNFFCSCERVFRPDLNGRPVVVLSNNDGCVIARSKEAKAMGVDMCLPYYQMLEKFDRSGITAFSSNYTLYGDLSARVMAILSQDTPSVLQYSIDEAFIDLHGIDPSTLKEFGERLAAKIRRWTGVPVSIGIAPTKTLAKVAVLFAKRYPAYRKCCIIDSEARRFKALQLTDVSDVWGVGSRTARALRAEGVNSALDFAQCKSLWVRRRFHVTGERTWRELRGENAVSIDSLDVPHKSILTSRSFPGMITSLEELTPHVANYAARCALKLRRQHSVCGMVTVFADSNRFREDLQQYRGSAYCRFSTPTSSTPEIVQTALNVLQRIYRPDISFKRAGVMVTDLSSDAAIQPDLFSYDPDLARKYRSLSEAIDEINNRLGADTVILASQQYRAKDSRGKNVKFTSAIRRALKSPDYSTSIDAFRIH